MQSSVHDAAKDVETGAILCGEQLGGVDHQRALIGGINDITVKMILLCVCGQISNQPCFFYAQSTRKGKTVTVRIICLGMGWVDKEDAQ